jgi:hypothetical protein
LESVLKQSGVRPGEAISIGDGSRDIEAATAEGIPFGAVAFFIMKSRDFLRSKRYGVEYALPILRVRRHLSTLLSVA